jgi:hypothetical protein
MGAFNLDDALEPSTAVIPAEVPGSNAAPFR